MPAICFYRLVDLVFVRAWALGLPIPMPSGRHSAVGIVISMRCQYFFCWKAFWSVCKLSLSQQYRVDVTEEY